MAFSSSSKITSSSSLMEFSVSERLLYHVSVLFLQRTF